jgi:ribosomal protein S6
MALETENNEAAEGVYADETRVYELGFHLDAELGQEEVKKHYQSIRDHITRSGTIVAEGEPTKIPLAYTISRQETTGRRDFDTAYFCWIAYETDSAAHEELLTFVQGITSIIRFIDIRTDRETAHHAAEMHELFIRNAAEAAAGFEEEVDGGSDAEAAEPAADAEPRKETEV